MTYTYSSQINVEDVWMVYHPDIFQWKQLGPACKFSIVNLLYMQLHLALEEFMTLSLALEKVTTITPGIALNRNCMIVLHINIPLTSSILI